MRWFRPMLHYYFNSRTHVECDTIWQNLQPIWKISTHALTWSATAAPQPKMVVPGISTHALTWSAT